MTDNKTSSVFRNNSENAPVFLTSAAAMELYYEIKKALDIDEMEGTLTEKEFLKAVGLK